jgi:heme exporter protein D
MDATLRAIVAEAAGLYPAGRKKARTMTAHALYVAAAYGVSALAIAALIAWVLLDSRARRREMAELEASGLRRRSDRKDAP